LALSNPAFVISNDDENFSLEHCETSIKIIGTHPQNTGG